MSPWKFSLCAAGNVKKIDSLQNRYKYGNLPHHDKTNDLAKVQNTMSSISHKARTSLLCLQRLFLWLFSCQGSINSLYRGISTSWYLWLLRSEWMRTFADIQRGSAYTRWPWKIMLNIQQDLTITFMCPIMLILLNFHLFPSYLP